MLNHLAITNYTIVDQLALDFKHGMTVVTGETGAGKSIMLDALGLALGDRASANLVSIDQSKAEITASFEIVGNPEAQSWLAERDLSNEDGLCILRRVITSDGRSRAFINGVPSTIADLKLLGDMLVDIHSQHEHQSLLKRDTQRRLLDEFGMLTKDVDGVHRVFADWQANESEYERLRTTTQEQAARQQLLSYQSDELNELALAAGEVENLEAEQKRLDSAELVIGHCRQVLALLAGDDGNSADQLHHAIYLLQELDDPELLSPKELLSSSLIQIDEAATDLGHFLDNFQSEPERLAEVENRLSKIYDIARKHRVRISEIPNLQIAIDEELEQLEHIDDRLEQLSCRVQEFKDSYFKLAAKLSDARKRVALDLQQLVTEKLTSLGIGDGEFLVSLNQASPSRYGIDDVEYLISTNKGHEAGPLSRIASGGELSRISLAIQVVVADTSSVPTLVFDEVDVGIGGAIAEVVGNLLKKLGNQTQIICVTHLPQVAAQGHHHLYVTKLQADELARTRVGVLDESAKIAEIARMLGGIDVTEQSLAHAQEMFRSAQA